MKIDSKKRGPGGKKEPLTLIAFRHTPESKAALDELLARANATGHNGPIKSAVIRQAIKDTAEEIHRGGVKPEHLVVCVKCHQPASTHDLEALAVFGWSLWLGGARCPDCIILPKKLAAWQAADHKVCQAGRDGECNWVKCPQVRDSEPMMSGRHCPLDMREEE